MANPIRVIGVGPGSPEFITPAALDQIKDSDILIGGERVLRPFEAMGKEQFIIKNNLKETADFIREKYHNETVAVLASGDPSFYGILEFLKRNFNKSELSVLPGISSAQLACARLCISWHDAAFFSVHGRNTEGLHSLVNTYSKVIVLTDPGNTPASIAERLGSDGVMKKKVYVCENLSYEDERITEWDITKVPNNVGLSGCIMVISDE